MRRGVSYAYEEQNKNQMMMVGVAAACLLVSVFAVLRLAGNDVDPAYSPDGWVTEADGEFGTTSYAVRVFRGDDQAPRGSKTPISIWHDIPLRPPGAEDDVFYFTNEIPCGTTKKFETQTEEPWNPIRQDTKKGKLREYTYGKTFFNYGAIPRTWEDPNVIDPIVGEGGDNDPVDAIEISNLALGVGQVIEARVLGAYGLVDQGEIDWKVLVITANDPNFAVWQTLSDVPDERLEAIKDWLINYKTTDGKPQNKIEPETPLGKAGAIKVLEDSHEYWKELRAGKTPTRGLWTGPDPQVSLTRLLATAMAAVHNAGEAIREVQRSHALNTQAKGKTDEGLINPLTQADLVSHWILKQTFANMWGDVLTVVSEEEDFEKEIDHDVEDVSFKALDAFDEDGMGFSVAMDDVAVWVDPLDATYEFSKGLLEYVTVMACVTVRGTPVGGVIYQPFAPEPRVAWALADVGHDYGHRSSANATAYTAAYASGSPRVAVSLSHKGAVAEAVDLIGGRMVGAAGSGFKSLLVLDERADVYVHRTKIKKWDLCAADALVRATGGKFTDWKGSEFDYSAPPVGDAEAAKEWSVVRGGVIAVGPKADTATYVRALSSIDPQ